MGRPRRTRPRRTRPRRRTPRTPAAPTMPPRPSPTVGVPPRATPPQLLTRLHQHLRRQLKDTTRQPQTTVHSTRSGVPSAKQAEGRPWTSAPSQHGAGSGLPPARRSKATNLRPLPRPPTPTTHRARAITPVTMPLQTGLAGLRRPRPPGPRQEPSAGSRAPTGAPTAQPTTRRVLRLLHQHRSGRVAQTV